jgi:L-threonylcarbamoyladenylate synthase
MKIVRSSDKNFLEIAAEAIRTGQVLVCPTDTVYGLVCDATNEKAVENIFEIKKRPKKKPLPIFVKDIEMAKIFAEIGKEQEEFLKKFWPGKVTVVLKSKFQNPNFKIYGVAEETIALRIPDHQVISYLLSVIGTPLTGTSANISGQPALTKISEVLKQFTLSRVEGPDLIIDVGDLPISKPSRVVDLTSKKPKIIRE